jgi:DNA-binding GntR family transcriptional regulator
MPDTLEYRGKRDALVQQLREAILLGDLAVGERLRQQEIASRFRVSPTPVREALRILEAQGLVVHEPHRGVTVADLAGTFDQVYRLRGALESLATEMAVEHMTEDVAGEIYRLAEDIDSASRAGDNRARQAAHARFHLLLYETCGFPALTEMIKLLWARFPWDELLALPGLSTAHDHHEIAELAAAGDPGAAADRLRAHLESVRSTLTTELRERQLRDRGASRAG